VLHCASLRCALCLQAPWEDFADRMAELGFEKGWGRDVSLVREQFRQLLDILQVGGRVLLLSFE
jgi:hypothetical protein